MYCPQCGTQNDDSAAFCGNCGEKLSGGVNQTTTAQNSSSTAQTIVKPAVKYSSNPVLNAVKKLALSPLCLIAAVAFSLMVLFYISNAEVIGVNAMGIVRGVLEEAGVFTSDISAALSLLNGTARVFAFIVMLPNIIIAIGIWITLYSAFDKNKDSVSISGLGVIRVVISVITVLTVLSAVAYVILSLISFSKIKELGATLPPLIFFVMLLILGVMIFRIFCLVKMKEIVDSFRYTISYKTPDVPSSFVAIISFISCGGYTIFALMQGALSNWCGAAAFLCFGLLIIKYRATMKELQSIARTFLYDEDNGEASSNNAAVMQNDANNKLTRGVAVFVVIATVAAIIIGFSFTHTAPGIDKQLVGEWQYGDTDEHVLEFKRNGVYIGNSGTEYEETGTYTATDGVITLLIDGEINEIRYKIINSDKIQIEREYIDYSTWERKTKWETLYRVD